MENDQQEPKKKSGGKDELKPQDNNEIEIIYKKQIIEKQQPNPLERWASEKSEVIRNTGIKELSIISLDQGRLLIKSKFKDEGVGESVLNPTARTISLGDVKDTIDCSKMTDEQMLYTAHLCNAFQHYRKKQSGLGVGDLIAKDNNGNEIDYENDKLPNDGCSLIFQWQTLDLQIPFINSITNKEFLSKGGFQKNYSFLSQNPGFKSLMTAINKWINSNYDD